MQGIYLVGEIGVDITIPKIESKLYLVNKTEPIKFYLTSYGGSLDEGLAIGMYLANLPNAEIEILGMAYSAAVALLLNFPKSKRKIREGSQIMIHQASLNAGGNSEDLAKMSELLKLQDERIANYYSQRIEGTTLDFWLNLLKEKSFISDSKAVELGFFSEITKTILNSTSKPHFMDNSILAKLDASLSKIANYMTGVKNTEPEPVPTNSEDETINDLTAQINALKAELSEKEAEIIAMKSKSDTMETEMENLQTQNASFAKIQNEMKAEYNRINELVKGLKNADSKNAVNNTDTSAPNVFSKGATQMTVNVSPDFVKSIFTKKK